MPARVPNGGDPTTSGADEAASRCSTTAGEGERSRTRPGATGSERGAMPATPPDDGHSSRDATCESCGSSIDTSDWYPLAKERGPDGSLRLYPFCSEDCRDTWLDAREREE